MKVDDNFHHRIEPIIKQAGALILSFFNKPLVSWKKKSNNSLVTQADYESEAYLMSELKKINSDVSFIAEETGTQGEGDFCWVIDPIDGTSNFINKIPYFCISIALVHKGIPLFSAIYQPITNEYFYAYAKKGSYLNGSLIQVSTKKELERSIVIVGSPAITINRKKVLEHLSAQSGHQYKTISYRYFGAAALDQAYVASGRLQALYFKYLEWWDIAAGMLLIEQAGGKVSDFKGNSKKPQEDHSYLAGSPLVYNALYEIIKR